MSRTSVQVKLSALAGKSTSVVQNASAIRFRPAGKPFRMPTIYRKTAKGLAEIDTRAHRLPPRTRSMLILVDGKRDADDLKALVTVQAEECLRSLSEQGFIEAVGETVRPSLATGTVAAPGAASSTPAAPPAGPAVDVAGLGRMAVRALNEALGPSAESLAMRIERARTVSELRPLLEQGARLLAAARGPAAAAAFAERFQLD